VLPCVVPVAISRLLGATDPNNNGRSFSPLLSDMCTLQGFLRLSHSSQILAPVSWKVRFALCWKKHFYCTQWWISIFLQCSIKTPIFCGLFTRTYWYPIWTYWGYLSRNVYLKAPVVYVLSENKCRWKYVLSETKSSLSYQLVVPDQKKVISLIIIWDMMERDVKPSHATVPFKGTVAWDGYMSCSVTFQKMIEDLKNFCLGHLLAE